MFDVVQEFNQLNAHYSNYLYQFELKILPRMVLLLALLPLLQWSVLLGLPQLPCKRLSHGKIVKVCCFLCFLAAQDSSINDIVCPLGPTNNQSLGSIKE